MGNGRLSEAVGLPDGPDARDSHSDTQEHCQTMKTLAGSPGNGENIYNC